MRLPVAMIGMQAYIEILEKERNNLELIALTLDILVAVVQDEDLEEGLRFLTVCCLICVLSLTTFFALIFGTTGLFDFLN